VSSRKLTDAERAEILDELRALCPPGSTIYTVLRGVSSSGMSRKIDLYVIRGDVPHRITWSVCRLRVAGMTYDDRSDAARISGAGMDMGFHAVYQLASVLYAGTERAGYTLSHRWL
jgi:hypothetical protein